MTKFASTWWLGNICALAIGCGDGANGPAKPDPVTITVIRNDHPLYMKGTDEILGGYTQEHGHVTVKDLTMDYRSLVSTLLADLSRDRLEVDLVFMPPSLVCSFAANLADVPADLITLSDAQNRFFTAPLEGSTCNQKLKGLPAEYNLEYGGVVVNVTRYKERFGGKTPDWKTWDAFIADAAALSEFDLLGRPCTNGLDLSPDWPQPAEEILYSQILQRNGTYWSTTGEFDFTTPEATASLEAMVKWIAVDKVMSTSLIPERNTFVTSRLAAGATGYGCGDVAKPLSVMGYAGTWALPATRAEAPASRGDQYDFFALPPMVGSEHRFVQNSGWAWAVPRTSKNQKVAWEMIRQLALVPEKAARWSAIGGALPALKVNGTVEAAAGDPILARVQPMLAKGIWRGYFPAAATDTIEAAVLSNVFAAATGKKPVAQALADMEETANRAVKESR